MIVLGAFVAGALWGGLQAKRRKGTRLDVLQYAAGYGIAFAIVGLFVAVAIDWQLQ